MDEIVRQTKTGCFVIRSAHRRRSIRAAILTAMLQTVSAADQRAVLNSFRDLQAQVHNQHKW